MTAIDAARVRRESLRWYLILALNNARPEELAEEVVQSTMRAIYPDTTQIEIRRELDYLCLRGLVHVRDEPSGRRWSKLTHHGMDLAEYTISCEPGIARPEKYWT